MTPLAVIASMGELADALRVVRMRRGISQMALEVETRMQFKQVNKLEHGKKYPGRYLEPWMRGLGVRLILVDETDIAASTHKSLPCETGTYRSLRKFVASKGGRARSWRMSQVRKREIARNAARAVGQTEERQREVNASYERDTSTLPGLDRSCAFVRARLYRLVLARSEPDLVHRAPGADRSLADFGFLGGLLHIDPAAAEQRQHERLVRVLLGNDSHELLPIGHARHGNGRCGVQRGHDDAHLDTLARSCGRSCVNPSVHRLPRYAEDLRHTADAHHPAHEQSAKRLPLHIGQTHRLQCVNPCRRLSTERQMRYRNTTRPIDEMEQRLSFTRERKKARYGATLEKKSNNTLPLFVAKRRR